MPSKEAQRLMFDQPRDETFPVIRPLSQLPNRIPLSELYESTLKNKKGTCRLAPPDTAVLAEIKPCDMISNRTRSIACSIRKCPIAICIRNTLLSSLEDFVGPMLFPRCRIAIKSGLYRTFNRSFDDLKGAIYVACPEAIEILGLAEADESKVPKSWIPATRSSELSSIGDEAFRSKEYVLASLWYSAAAEAAAGLSNTKVAAEAHLFHAVCMKKLFRYDKVIICSNRALRARQDYAEGFFFRALGLFVEQNCTYAFDDLRRALELAPGDKQVQLQISNSRQLAHQQETGEYDVAGFFLEGCKPEKAPEWANFTSEAIEIRMTRDGRGRGVFLTGDVKAGELLMVSNPLVSSLDSLDDLHVKAIWKWSLSSRARRIFKALQDDPRSGDEMPVPDIGEFATFPGNSSRWFEEDGEEMDVQRIKKVADVASRLSFKMRVGNKQVFGLPAFVNHSCLPNSSMVVIGGALFVRAAASIQAGEEITVSYIDCLQPLGNRSKMIEKAWDFTCSCRRCKVETRFKKQLQSVPELSHSSSLEALVKRVEKLESALAKLNLSDEERGMIQIGYVQDYLRLARNMDQEVCQGISQKFKVLSEIEAMVLLRRFVPGHGKGIALISRIVREYLLRLEWHPSFEVEFDDAIAAMIGKITLPSEDYITLCDHLQSDEIVSSLFGVSSTGL